ncbi:MAG TPA: DNA-3-methyladenine glycosylase I [Candidatus Baltobacteraceae bacterium]|nr:DNA-3-methyladenine glycosylase I [Candidatus Baltobacteraceae bacterium]
MAERAASKKSAAKAKSGVKNAGSKKRVPPPVRVPKNPTPTDRVPRVVANPTLDDHLEIITRAVMQAGLSWAFIDARWEAYRKAFDGFDVRAVAAYDDGDVDRLMHDDGIIHSRPKIEGTIRNARTLLALEREFGSIRAYQTSFGEYDAIRKDTKKRFAFLGDLSTYYWLFRTGAPVPDLEDWMKTQERDHPRMREMVALASSGS